MFRSLGISKKNGETLLTPSPFKICRSHIPNAFHFRDPSLEVPKRDTTYSRSQELSG
jgi:hypothetical protein